MGGASSIGGEDVRPSRDVQSLLIPESHVFIGGSMSKSRIFSDSIVNEFIERIEQDV